MVLVQVKNTSVGFQELNSQSCSQTNLLALSGGEAPTGSVASSFLSSLTGEGSKSFNASNALKDTRTLLCAPYNLF